MNEAAGDIFVSSRLEPDRPAITNGNAKNRNKPDADFLGPAGAGRNANANATHADSYYMGLVGGRGPTTRTMSRVWKVSAAVSMIPRTRFETDIISLLSIATALAGIWVRSSLPGKIRRTSSAPSRRPFNWGWPPPTTSTACAYNGIPIWREMAGRFTTRVSIEYFSVSIATARCRPERGQDRE